MTFPGFKIDDSTNMIISDFLSGNYFVTGPHTILSKGLIKNDDKVVPKVIRYPSTITGGITDNLIFRRNNFNKRSLIKSINDNA
ncbi:hypothetical protein SDC9_176877 [bioreactor metagenome]|uniref:Uncharacterized protein n=1 Tax=bioreactor metagenome TaxID=1076179 RepID=A0A645GZE4_9ZZZZ